MSKRFFPCETTTRSRNQNPFPGARAKPQATIRLTWSSASSSSRSCPVAMGMMSSTLGAAGLSPAGTRQSTCRSATGTAGKTRSGEGEEGLTGEEGSGAAEGGGRRGEGSGPGGGGGGGRTGCSCSAAEGGGEGLEAAPHGACVCSQVAAAAASGRKEMEWSLGRLDLI